MSEVRAYIVGNSHVRGMMRIAVKWPEKLRGMKVLRFGKEESEDWITGKKLIALGRSCEVPLFLSRPGALHNHVSLFDPGVDYDVLGVADRSRPDNQIIPRRIFNNWILEEHFSSPFVRRLSKAWSGRVHFLAIPPPKQSMPFLHDRLSRRSLASQHVGGVMQAPLGRPKLRLDIWKLEQDVVRQWAQEHGIGFIDPPAKTLNEDGFLARRFYENDLTHSNMAYGLEMLHHLDQVVRELHGK